jgi:hypothetical protein
MNCTSVTGRRRLVFVALAAFAMLASPFALSHGPTRQKVVETVEINAPAEKVWALVGDFAGWQKWHPAIESSTADKANEVGSVRRLNIKGGKFLEEELEAFDAAAMSIKYRIKSGDALPVTNYSSTIRVSSIGNKCTVEWRGAFYRGYPNNNPPPEQSDEAAVAAVTGVYKTGLEQLKTLAEK